MFRLAKILLIVLVGTLPLSGTASAETLRIMEENGVALGGRDVVAYFTKAQAVPGSRAHALRWRGLIWLFSSAETLAAFEANPDAYLPQFGGYCPVALAEGREVMGSPDNFMIEGGKLYFFTEVQARASVIERDKAISEADGVWLALEEEGYAEESFWAADTAEGTTGAGATGYGFAAGD